MAFSLPVWLIITLIMVGVLIILFKTMNQVYVLSLVKDNFLYFFIFGVFIFLTISLTHIHSTYDIDFKTSEGVKEAMGIYYGWFSNVVSNIGKVTAYIVQQDWVNGTAKEK